MITTRLIAYRHTATTSSGNNKILLEVTQKGKTILKPTEDTVKGPIRLRLVSSLPSLPSSLPSSLSQKGGEQQD